MVSAPGSGYDKPQTILRLHSARALVQLTLSRNFGKSVAIFDNCSFDKSTAP